MPPPPRDREGNTLFDCWEVRRERPRLAYPRWEQEDADSLAMSTDDLMKTHQIESVTSRAYRTCAEQLCNYIASVVSRLRT